MFGNQLPPLQRRGWAVGAARQDGKWKTEYVGHEEIVLGYDTIMPRIPLHMFQNFDKYVLSLASSPNCANKNKAESSRFFQMKKLKPRDLT